MCPAGLDSSNAARVVDILAGLAGAGVTVIITIHQPRPDVFHLMQRVMILSGDGRLVYSGQHPLSVCCTPHQELRCCWQQPTDHIGHVFAGVLLANGCKAKR